MMKFANQITMKTKNVFFLAKNKKKIFILDARMNWHGIQTHFDVVKKKKTYERLD